MRLTTLMALADRTQQSGKAATRQRGGQSPSCFLMAPTPSRFAALPRPVCQSH